jgi:hypothetical protein
MENMNTQPFNFMHEQQQAKTSGNLATPQQEISSSSGIPQQVTTERLSVENRADGEEDSEERGYRMSSYPDIRDVHRRNSPMNYFDYSLEETRYPERNLMNSDELSSRIFGSLMVLITRWTCRS